MTRCLIVIDMQEDYVGMNRDLKRYPYDASTLIEAINERIVDYSPGNVFYVVNRFFYEPRRSPKALAAGLDKVSDNVFEKRHGSFFTNAQLRGHLSEIDVDSFEMVGVDGNYCVARSASDAARRGFSVLCNEHCIGIADQSRYTRTRAKLARKSVKFI